MALGQRWKDRGEMSWTNVCFSGMHERMRLIVLMISLYGEQQLLRGCSIIGIFISFCPPLVSSFDIMHGEQKPSFRRLW